MQIVDILELLVPDVWTAITQLCATAILFFLMYKLAWKPVKKILDERSKFEQQKLSEAAALKEENEKTAKEAKNIISDANRDAEMIVKEAREEGQNLKNELIEEGKRQSAQLLENAKHDMEMQKAKMMEEMRSEIVDTAIAAAEKVLQNNVDPDAERQSINSFVKEVISK
ncbi:MAG: F0F1 ATP synthase subunit B [Erysipelotrichaceae bacterium]|jgi:F-type H+-transporting ATPase subunit b|nr:F0F1 ATP synthase subunit B [Erysipelotrichaceae bacterium]MBR6233773.1 F0F1 ATP synthase subunit B [Erysipelotrichaceae bacterium]